MKKSALVMMTLVFLLVGFTNANVIASTSQALSFPSYGVISSLETFLGWETTITWGDGTVETIETTDKGRLHLNGTEGQAFGFIILDIGVRPSASVANNVLDWCQSKGVRFMTVLMRARYDNDAGLDFWLPKLYDRKMFAHLWVIPSSAGLGKAGMLDTTVWKNGFKAVVDKIVVMNKKELVIGFSLSDEWDLHVGTFGITQSELQTWFDDCDTYARNYLATNSFERPVMHAVNGGTSWARNMTLAESDFPFQNWGIGSVYTSALDYHWNEKKGYWNDAGHGDKQAWLGSVHYAVGENADNSKMTPEYMTHMLSYPELSAYFIWYLWEGWYNGVENHNMFDMNGDPYPWTETLAPYFP